MLVCQPIPIFTDNYVWCLIDQNSSKAWVVDPGDASPVEQYLNQEGLQLEAILITHHHFDHVGGVKKLIDEYAVPVVGSIDAKFQGISEALNADDHFEILGEPCQIISVPGHTLDHVAFFMPASSRRENPWLFCGDTLFSAGCGRLFEGSPQQMHDSLNLLSTLPGDTLVFCTHEYTIANLKFALSVDNKNESLRTYASQCQAKRDAGRPTLPTSIDVERSINPFLRCDDAHIISHLKQLDSAVSEDEVAVFTALRALKDKF